MGLEFAKMLNEWVFALNYHKEILISVTKKILGDINAITLSRSLSLAEFKVRAWGSINK